MVGQDAEELDRIIIDALAPFYDASLDRRVDRVRAAWEANTGQPFRDALMMEIAAAGDDHKALRKIAAAPLAKAGAGDVPAINGAC